MNKYFYVHANKIDFNKLYLELGKEKTNIINTFTICQADRDEQN